MKRVVCLAVVLLCPVIARAGAPKDLIPYGDRWFCTPISGVSVCSRSQSTCESKSDGNDCREQAKASVVTFFDVMQEDWNAVALGSTQACGLIRKVLTKDPDKKSVSTCQLVGRKLPPPAKLASKAIPGGTAWFCASDGTPCFRDEAECTSAPEGKDGCKKLPHVWLYTASETMTGLTFYGFASSKLCQDARDENVFLQDEVSSCTNIGATTGPPVTKGWFCFEGTKEAGHCLRTQEDCDARRAYDLRRDYGPGECAHEDRAYAFLNRGEPEGYPTFKECEAARVAAKAQTACLSTK